MANRKKKLTACQKAAQKVDEQTKQYYRQRRVRRNQRQTIPNQQQQKAEPFEMKIQTALSPVLGSKTTKFFTEYSSELKSIWDFSDKWIRPLEQFKVAKNRKGLKLFKDLIDHLFVAYNLPSFMYKVWEEGERLALSWFFTLAKGQNISKAKALPIPLTKKMAHHYQFAPGDLTPQEALYWAYTVGKGGTVGLANVIAASRIPSAFLSQFDFWDNVITYFINQPKLAPKQITELINYAHYARFEERNAQFTFKGKSLHRLLREKNEWLDLLRQLREAEKQGKVWNRSSIKEFQLKEGTGKRNIRYYVIEELLSERSLVMESKLMSHCVKSYADRCYRGYCSIWSLSKYDRVGHRSRLLTIEVSRDKRICQVRGKGNRTPHLAEIELLKQWAKEAKLKM